MDAISGLNSLLSTIIQVSKIIPKNILFLEINVIVLIELIYQSKRRLLSGQNLIP